MNGYNSKLNTLRFQQNGRYFAMDFKCIFMNKKFSFKFFKKHISIHLI